MLQAAPFTLSMPRAAAKRLVRRAGGMNEERVSHRTDVVVVGEQSPPWKADNKGQKLLDLECERDLGHPIALINERRFLALVG
jgi:BRCT domain type II-containing protein